MRKSLLSIAGFDPSGGAGVLLDIVVFESLGFRGLGVLTAVAPQNPHRAGRFHALPASAVREQFDRLAEWTPISGLKVGMLGTGENLRAVALLLRRAEVRPRIVDPVFRSSSGAWLLDLEGRRRFLKTLSGAADLITPNLDEAEALTGRPVVTVGAMKEAAQRIADAAGMACLVKGGHLRARAIDILYDGRSFSLYEREKADRDVHGTGCYLSAALTAELAKGLSLVEACGRATALVAEAILNAEPAGAGRWVFAPARQEAPRTPASRRSRRAPDRPVREAP